MKFFLKFTGVLFLLLVLNSCGFVERDFLGKWEVYDLELQSEWRGNIVDDDMRKYYEDITYEFLPEGKMIYTHGNLTTEGTWSIDGENLNMHYTFTYSEHGLFRDEDLKCKILSCTGGKMALSLKLNKNETWVLYFQEK
ncbi:MAG: hypothetical protein Crog4KO_33050 [Crocinitomicaceae bacterium]